MEDNAQNTGPDYTKQYNNGYLLSKHAPELANKLAKAFGDSKTFEGFGHGRDQYARERQREARLSWLYRGRTQADKDLLPDKDKEGPDKE